MDEFVTKTSPDDLNWCDTLEDGERRMFVFDETVKMDTPSRMSIDGLFVILCVDGSIRFTINGIDYVAGKDDIMIGMPEAVIGHIEAIGNLRIRGLFLSLDYVFKMLPLSARSWNFRMFFDKNPKISLSKAGVDVFNLYYGLLKSKLADKHNPYRYNIVDALMQAFALDFRSVFDGMVCLTPRSISSAENIFNDFIELLLKSYPKSRSVAYYADKLNITAKYLSVVCKKVAGKTASKIIDAYVMKDIERLLKSSKRSVKEISNELAFPNISFFGRYVKKNLGCTPNELRRKLNGVGK